MARTMTMAEANQIAQQRIEELERELLKYKDGQFFERYERLESQLQALREALETIVKQAQKSSVSRYVSCVTVEAIEKGKAALEGSKNDT